MGRPATADVVVRSKQKGQGVYKNVQQSLDKINSQVKTFGLVSGAAAIGGVAALTASSFRQVDALAKHSDRLGTSTAELAAYQHVTELTGGSSDTLSKSLFKAEKALGEFAVTGSGTAAPFLRQLNFDTDALLKLEPVELFEAYAEKIRGLGTRQEQAAATSALFADRTGEMLNLIDAGQGAIDDAEETVIKYGIALDRVDSAKVEAANDAMFEARQRAVGIGNVIAAKVAPIITAMANRFIDAGIEADVMGVTADRAIDKIAGGAGLVADAIFGWQLLFQGTRIVVLDFAAGFVGAFADIERAADLVGDKVGGIFGLDDVDVTGGTLGRIEESLIASSKHASGVLGTLSQTERPSVAIAKALEKARIESQELAEAAAAARDRLKEIKIPTFEESEREANERKSAERAEQVLKDQLQRKLDIIETSHLIQEDKERQAAQRRQDIVDQAEEKGLISKERAAEINAEIQERLQKKLTEIAKKGLDERQKFLQLSNKAQAKDVFSTLENITAGVANTNKTMFRLNQAAAIANAIINTHEGVTKTLAKYPWPLSGILAAAHLAAGVAQVAAIRSASFGGGTTPSLAGSTPTVNDQPVTPNDQQAGNQNGQIGPGTTITFIVQGNIVGEAATQELIKNTIGELVDQDVILIPAESRNAEEIRGGSGSGG